MSKCLQSYLAGLIKTGYLEIETESGQKFTLGDGSGIRLGLRFKDMAAIFQLVVDPELQFGDLIWTAASRSPKARSSIS